jgi:hypothetical protein
MRSLLGILKAVKRILCSSPGQCGRGWLVHRRSAGVRLRCRLDIARGCMLLCTLEVRWLLKFTAERCSRKERSMLRRGFESFAAARSIKTAKESAFIVTVQHTEQSVRCQWSKNKPERMTCGSRMGCASSAGPILSAAPTCRSP